MLENIHSMKRSVCGVLFLVLAITPLLFVSGCSPVKVEDYQDVSPAFDIPSFFDGRLMAYGIVKNRSGKMIRHFTAAIDASWENGVGTLDERFTFNDGEEQRRVWTLKKQGAHYIGTAGDVVGEAKLTHAGNALFLKYVLQVPYKGSTIDVTVDDRMYLVNPKVLINESAMSKFGFDVGEVVLTIVKE